MYGAFRKTSYVNKLQVCLNQLKKQVNEELLRKKDEEKRRKIINQHLMPLTRGNSFMRDFYSGRY